MPIHLATLRIPRALRLVCGLAASLALAWVLAVPCAQAAYMVPGQPIRPKDFTLIKKDGSYHLFYIRNNAALPIDMTENSFGHAVSNDLFYWQQLPPVMVCDPEGWDNLHVWAPHVIERDGLYWMLYTGVQRSPDKFADTQMMGLAVSSDLMNWTRVENSPVFNAEQVPWAWWAPLSPRPAFRDPFVMPDPAHPGDWLMYYTANYATDTTATVVGVARSEGDFTQWQDLKPITITYKDYTYNTLTESPHLFQHNGLWYLFITTSSGQPLTFYTSPDPTGDLPAWTYRGRLRSMLGYDTAFFYASEFLRDGLRDYFAFVNGDRIEFREILWGSSWQFTLVQPPLLNVLSMDWQQTPVQQGDLARLNFRLANAFAGTVQLEALWRDAAGGEHPVSLDSLGLPTYVSFQADTGTLVWSARRWPPVSDTTTSAEVIVRLADHRSESGVLTVTPPPPQAPPPTPEPSDTPPPPDPTNRLRRGPSLRALENSPLGPGPAVVLELEAATPCRAELYDITGRRVRRLADRLLPAGVSVLPWDGRDDTGARMPRGVYFVRVTTPAATLGTRLLWLAP